MIFSIRYTDGNHLTDLESIEGADAAYTFSKQKCTEMSKDSYGLVLISPSLIFHKGKWVSEYDGVRKTLYCDSRRKLSWSADGYHWESCFHAIERLFNATE